MQQIVKQLLSLQMTLTKKNLHQYLVLVDCLAINNWMKCLFSLTYYYYYYYYYINRFLCLKII